MRVVIAVTALLLAAGCGSNSLTSKSEPAPAATSEVPASTLAPLPRVSYATICPELLKHEKASAHLLAELFQDAQALADGGDTTTDRFNAIIEDLEYDKTISPEPLVPFIEWQLGVMRELRDYVHVGGELNTDVQLDEEWATDLREYLSAGQEIINQCRDKI